MVHKKIFILALFISSVALISSQVLYAADKLNVVATTTALADIANEVAQGKIRAYGISTDAPAVAAAFHRDGGCAAVQLDYSLLNRGARAALLPWCSANRVATVIRGPLAQGLLTGKYRPGHPPPPDSRAVSRGMGGFFRRDLLTPPVLEAIGRVSGLAAQVGLTPAQFALAWVLNKTGITSIVCGATSVEQLEQNMGAVDLRLSQEELEACDEVWHSLHPPRLFYGR